VPTSVVVPKNPLTTSQATETTAVKADSARYYDQVQTLLDLVLRLTEKGQLA
jgi:hypothetical protein